MKRVTVDQVEAALASIDKSLASEVSKASDDDLDQAEGADLGNPAKEKMSDAAKAKKSKMAPMMAKGEDKEEKEEGEDEEGEEKEEKPAFMKEKSMKKGVKKSFNEDLPEEIETKIDVSNFLKSLVDHTASSVDGLRDYVAKSDRNTNARYDNLAGAVGEIQKSQAMLGVVLKAICQRIGVIEAAPARSAKADTVAKSDAAAADRNFSSGLAVEKEAPKGIFKSLSQDPIIAKSQVADAILALVVKGEAKDLDLIGFESGGYIRPEIVTKLQTSLN